MQATQQNAPLKRTMKTRHLIMLSLGGVIGTGLFFNTGYIISTTGAAGTLLAYLIGALVVLVVLLLAANLAFHIEAGLTGSADVARRFAIAVRVSPPCTV